MEIDKCELVSSINDLEHIQNQYNQNLVYIYDQFPPISCNALHELRLDFHKPNVGTHQLHIHMVRRIKHCLNVQIDICLLDLQRINSSMAKQRIPYSLNQFRKLPLLAYDMMEL